MWIVDIALRRPYTFIVAALLILLATPLVLTRMAVDVLPEIDIPVISIIWTYNGLPAPEMAQRIALVTERSITTTVNDIEHVESQSLAGISVIKVFFQPGADVQSAIAQVVANVQSQVRVMPPGITPPLVLRYSASAIPVIQLGLSSQSLSEQELLDGALNFLRPRLIAIKGASVTYPYGGKPRLVAVDIDNDRLLAKGLTPTDIVNAVSAQNLILPSGTAKIGESEYSVSMAGSPDTIAGLNNIPVRSANGATTYLSEVAHVRDGFASQTNIVRQDGERGVLVSILKNGGASTLDVVAALKALMPEAAKSLPPEVNITPLFDQSVFVRAAIEGLVHEAIIAACLTAIMILVFLGNWRSTCIIAVSIPLSILSSILCLYAIGQTINIMTLGGLALAVGILVDDATVTIENIERHLHMGSDLHKAIRDGAGEIAVPALVSTICICIVFVPMFFLTGVAKFLFVPLAEAVVFAMLASYVLSRTLVPTMAMLMMKEGQGHSVEAAGFFRRIYLAFDRGFERFRRGYIIMLSALLARRRIFSFLFMSFCVLSCGLYPLLGQDFFPAVDSGQIRLHLRAPTGLRIEETARLTDEVERYIRSVIPADQLDTIVDNLGVPYSGINLSYSNAGTIGTLDAEVLIALKPEHDPTRRFVDRLRRELPEQFPGIEFFFQPANIVSQILNFGVPAAIDVQFRGNDQAGNFKAAQKLLARVRTIPGVVDAHIQQRFDQPSLLLDIDRTRIQQLGLNAVNVAQNLLVSLSGSFQTAPAFWLDPRNGVVYQVGVQTPQYRVNSIDALMNTPVASNQGGATAAISASAAGAAPGALATQLLGNLVTIRPREQQSVVSHFGVLPVVDIYLSVRGRDLGSVASEVELMVDEARGGLARGASVEMLGQVRTMQSSFVGLGVGLIMAIVLVYLLIVINFQSWVDPAIIISALPAALAGIAWMLFLTGTTLSVPALTGAIMTMGVATANSILVVSFARQRLDDGLPPLSAVLEAGATRLRPVMMTALAMIIGMVPMSLGLGEGGEQNAPLGRAVIGGLLFATVSTLVFVPLVFGGVHRRLHARRNRDTLPPDSPANPPQPEIA